MPWNNPEYARAYFQEHYLKNREKKKAYQRAYRAANREARKAADRAYYQATKEERLAYNRERYARKKASILEKCKQYYEKNKPHITQRNKAYAKRNRPRLNAINSSYNARKRGAVVSDLTRAQWESIKVAYHYRCAYCGCKPPRLEKEHVTPLSKGGNHTYTNVVPACRTCNAKKAAGGVLSPVQPLLLLG